MAKILVRSPVTSNGRDVVIDNEGKVRYKETILEGSARKILEQMNSKLPPVLRKVITDYDENEVAAPPVNITAEVNKPKPTRNARK